MLPLFKKKEEASMVEGNIVSNKALLFLVLSLLETILIMAILTSKLANGSSLIST